MLDLILALSISFYSSPNLDTIPKPVPQNEVQIIREYASRPVINAKAAMVMDLQTGTVLHKKNNLQSLPIASLTKLMTAQVILEENALDEVVTIPAEATQVGGSTMYLLTGEEITVENLLHGLLIQSGNDAAIALAIHNSGSVEAFVEKMNNKAKEYGLNKSNFQNPMGFDHPENYSSIYDLSQLAQKVYSNETVQSIVANKTITVTSVDGLLSHSLISTNDMLESEYDIIGLKTGSTELAGGCFIGITNGEHPKLSIVIGSQNRFHDTKILLDWARNTFSYQ